MKIKSIYQFSFLVCLVLLICAVVTPFSASAVSYVKNPSDAHGSDYTNSSVLAKKLDEVFAGDIDIYSNSGCTTEVSMPIGTSMSNSTQYYVKSKTTGNLCSGWQCYIYANAVYNKLNNEWVGNGGAFAHSETVISGGSNKLTYDMLKNAGVRCGAYMRTTNNSSGAFSGNYGHSLVILSYNSTSITYLEGNGDGNGAVRLTTETWSEFNTGELSGRNRYIAHIVQPTDAYYNSLYGMSGSNYTDSDKMATILNQIFAGDIDIYSNSSCTTEVSMPVGTNMSNSTQYYVKSKTTGNICSGWQCYIYANAVYNKIYNEWVGHGDSFAHSKKVISGGSNQLTYEMLKNAGVRCGAYMRTTDKSNGAYNGNVGHSLIILSYNSTSITYIEGNGDGNGAIRLMTETWSAFNSGELSGRGRYIAHIVQPTEEYYKSVYGSTSSGETSKYIMTAAELADKCYEIATEYKTLYVMGCFGAPMNSTNKDRYTSNHSYNQQADRTAMINAATADTFGFDCVCLIKGVLWGWNGDTSKTYGGASYASNGVSDMTIDTMLSKCTGVSTDFSNIEVGEILFYKDSTGYSHVGVYIGNGLAVESTPKWDNCVQVTAVANIGSKSGYNARTWYSHGKLTEFLDYNNTESDIVGSNVTEGEYYFMNGSYSMYMISDTSGQNNIGASTGTLTSKYQFKLVKDGEYYKVIPVDGKNGYLLNVFWLTKKESTAGDEISLYYHTGSLSQRWVFEKYANGYLIHPADNTDLSITREGNRLYLRTTTKSEGQIWVLDSVKCSHKYDNACDSTCNTCGETRTVADHVYSHSCDSTCNVCGHTRNDITHNWGDMYFVDSEYHREDCENCGAYRVYTHTFTDSCDDYCEDCDYYRAVSHTYDNACDNACNICGETRETSHEYDNACDNACNVCGNTRTVIHNLTSIEYSSEGHWWICVECGFVTDIGEHLFGEFVTKDPTCTETGEKHTMCVTCGYDIIAEIPPVDHNYGEPVVITPATCTESGVEEKTCANCGDVISNEISPLGHSYGAFVITNKPTCEEAGRKEKTCENCGDVIKETIPATDHKYGDWYEVSSDDDGNVTEKRDCKNCGEYEIQVIENPNPPKTLWEIIIEFFVSIFEWLFGGSKE